MAAKKTTAAKKKTGTASRSRSNSKSGSRSKASSSSRTTAKKASSSKSRTGKTSTAKPSAAETRQRLEELERNQKLNREIALWATLAIALLVAVSIFGYGGSFGEVVRFLFFGLFGMIAYIIPFIAAALIFFGAANNMSHAASKRITGFCLLVVSVCIFLSLLMSEGNLSGGISAFNDGVQNHWGGGFIGGFFASIFVRFIGIVGAYIIDIALFIISLVMITGFAALTELNSEERHAAIAEKKKEKEMLLQMQAEQKAKEKGNVPAKEKKTAGRFSKKANGIDLHSTNVTSNLHSADSEDSIETESAKNVSEDMKELNIHMFDENTASSASDSNSSTQDHSEHIQMEIPLEEFASEKRPLNIKPAADTVDKAPAVTETGSMDTDRLSDVRIHAQHLAEEENPHAIPNTEDTDPLDKIRQEKEEALNPKPSPVKRSRGDYKFPSTELLSVPKHNNSGASRESLEETANKLESVLRNFGVNVTVTDVSCGPAVTRFEIQPDVGVKVSRIVNLADDIKLNLAASDIRIEAPIPGKAAVGIEVPNKTTQMVAFRELVETREFQESKRKAPIAFAAGRDIAGHVVISDISKMPHLLIAGATGSGKSVCINTIIMSILYRAHPDDVKFIMIDPKVVELSVYNGIPHLLTDVVTDPKKAAGALQWAVKEMTNRYNKFAQAGVRDMKGYNAKIKNGKMKVHVNGQEMEVDQPKLPQIVVIVDELADLMMVASSEVEEAICRLAQLARAAGIHLIIATQRPSVNVITGLIKANMPSRIAFSVTSGVDSRTILDMVGAEKLLGKGDMLYYPQGFTKPLRVQGAFVSDDEVQKVVDFLRENNETDSDEAMEIAKQITESEGMIAIDGAPDADSERDTYFADAGRLIVDKEKGSIGMLQRYFKIGFNRAARIMDQLEEAGVVGPEEGTKPRRVLMTSEQFEQMLKG